MLKIISPVLMIAALYMGSASAEMRSAPVQKPVSTPIMDLLHKTAVQKGLDCSLIGGPCQTIVDCCMGECDAQMHECHAGTN